MHSILRHMEKSANLILDSMALVYSMAVSSGYQIQMPILHSVDIWWVSKGAQGKSAKVKEEEKQEVI